MKIFCYVITSIAIALMLFPGVSYGGSGILQDSFTSPLLNPAFGLDFDTTTNTLWGIENSSATANIMNFDLSGSLISGFNTESAWNNVGIAVNQKSGSNQRVFYYQNLGRNLRETYSGGSLISTTVLPWGYQNSARMLGYDINLDQIIVPHFGSSSLGYDAGFDFVIPNVGISSFVSFNFRDDANISNIMGFTSTADNYFVLGSKMSGAGDHIVKIDRNTLAVSGQYDLPGGTYAGLAMDSNTGLFYSNNWSTDQVNVFSLSEVSVVPEPVSSTLFIVGGATLGFRRLRKKFEK